MSGHKGLIIDLGEEEVIQHICFFSILRPVGLLEKTVGIYQNLMQFLLPFTLAQSMLPFFNAIFLPELVQLLIDLGSSEGPYYHLPAKQVPVYILKLSLGGIVVGLI